MRRGRRDPANLRVGDALDFWRVEAFEPERRLRLAAEMRLPGRAWLEFEVSEHEGKSKIRQTAIFDPLGLRGLAYWYALYPLHQLVFAGMLKPPRRDRRMLDCGRPSAWHACEQLRGWLTYSRHCTHTGFWALDGWMAVPALILHGLCSGGGLG